jgi:Aerotolerance regulator N-terminal
MIGLPLAFGAPLVLAGLIALPVIWWLLRLTPPKPNQEVFPPLKILARILKKDETPHKSPWWLTLLRLALSALVILALAEPVLNPQSAKLSGEGPLVLVIDNSWPSALSAENQKRTALNLINAAEAASRPVILLRRSPATARRRSALSTPPPPASASPL